MSRSNGVIHLYYRINHISQGRVTHTSDAVSYLARVQVLGDVSVILNSEVTTDDIS